MRILSIALLLFILFNFSACKDKTPDKKTTLVADTVQTKVLVLCEGNFMWGNASLDIYYPKTKSVVNDIYKKQNNSKPLGDVLQSGYISDGLIWLVLNNSGKIVAMDPVNFIWKKEIIGFKSPRYMVKTSGKFWVTDIYDNKVAIADPNGKTVSNKMTLKGWSEQILERNGEIWIANQRGWMYIIDPSAELVKDSIALKPGSHWMVTDKNDKIWALASDSGKSYLFCLDPGLRKVEKRFDLPTGKSAQRLVISKNRDTLFYLSDGVFAMPVNATTLSVFPFFPRGTANFYGLGVDPYSGEIYVANAKDYVSKGEAIVISSSGKEVHRFSTGIIPSSFLFYR